LDIRRRGTLQSYF